MCAFSRAVLWPISNRAVLLRPACLKSKPGTAHVRVVPCHAACSTETCSCRAVLYGHMSCSCRASCRPAHWPSLAMRIHQPIPHIFISTITKRYLQFEVPIPGIKNISHDIVISSTLPRNHQAINWC